METKFSALFRCFATQRHRLFPALLGITLLTSGAIVLGIASSTPGGGVDDTAVFELDGNALDDATIGTVAAPGDDWQNVYHTFINSGSPKAHTSITSFAGDTVNSQSDSSFLGTSSKDTQDIPQWSWTGSKSQAKDDISHAFAAGYTLSNGHTAVYAGMDRFDGSGDATAGFWFVQDSNFDLCTGAGQGSRGPNAGCTASGKFTGKHTVGDLLLVSDFSTGGAVATINVYVWNGNGVDLDASRSNANCNLTTGANTICGAVNSVDGVATGDWSFVDKSKKTTYLKGEFLEVGLDLDSVFKNGAPCFSTFFAETRSSNSPSASLSDLTAPVSFPLCGASITKACTTASIGTDGTTVTYNFGGQVTNTGVAGLNTIVVTDLPTPPANASVTNVTVVGPDLSGQPTAGVLASGASVPYTGSFQMNALSTSFQNKATVNAKTPGGSAIPSADGFWLSGSQTLTGDCAPAPSGKLALSKSCSTAIASGNPLTITVNFSGTVTNNSTVQVTDISVSDTPTATVTTSCNGQAASACSGSNGSLALAPGKSATYSGSYNTSVCSPTSGGIDGRCIFSDTVHATGVGALGAGHKVDATDVSATCPLCPAGTCAP
jgi:hypothetical protein